MSRALISQGYLEDIADAIRAKLNSQSTYYPSEMADAIASIEGGGTASELVENPDYFISECVDTAQKINALQNSDTLTLFFITDSHVYTSNNNLQYLDVQLASMCALSKMLKPDLVVHGGDMTNGSEAKSKTLAFTDHIVKCMREIGGSNTHILIGNHDGNTVQSTLDNEDQRITESEMLTLYRSWDDGFTYAGNAYQGGNFYGYRDYPSIGLRVIKLHSYREKIGDRTYDGGQGGNWGYYDDEVTWFQNVALNTDNTILIICHQTLSPVLQGYAESADIPHNGIQMQQAVDTWLSANSSHRCAGVIHGHVHWDYSAKGKGTFTVIDHSTKEQISRTGTHGEFYEHAQCFCNYMPSFGQADSTPTSGYRDVPTDAIFRGRKSGTASQGLWTAVVVDTEKEVVNLIRFGAGADKSYGYGATVYHTINNVLTHVTSSNPQTSVEDGESYTATLTAESGYTIDSYTVTMSGVDITSTAYSGGIVSIPSVTGNVAITATASKPRVNQLPLAVESDGASAYPTVTHPALTTVGYVAGYRLGSAGTESASASNFVTGFIPMTRGQTMTLEGIELPATNYSGYNTCYVAVYNSSFSCIKSNYSKDWHGSNTNPSTADSSNHILTLTINEGIAHEDLSSMAYVRISALAMSSESAIYIE